ncbi:hypothetical protein GCM10007103_32420 [Salinimicrobium marinum]|uniref:Plasmid stabilization system protein ParE n=1 Tax=Salinimicrobium marinum TaxID=680283 RepID=A0A918SJM3_9FLAO|nr:type II toxin-antitoxin system RelE/ParE family toxin [Salinimicrobium marinum]GHA49069.1 hypothetical protein GCM10007103_32420 [Salinimicrobium marinum]
MAGKQEKLVVEWTKTAEIQFFHILNYWTERNKSTRYAENLTELVWERTEFIAENPYASIEIVLQDVRKATLGHFSIFYRIGESKILIMAFWDNRQDPEKLYSILKNDNFR